MLRTFVVPLVITALAVIPGGQAAATDPTSGTDDLIKSLLLTALPRTYTNTKRWGQTTQRWDGLHLRLDGLQIKTKRRWKEVAHGTWTRYEATLVDPEQTLLIRSTNLRQLPDQRVAFDLAVDAQLQLWGRLSEWNWGVQLYSFSATAEARVRLTMTCELGLQFDTTRFPPDVVLQPRVSDPQLHLQDFRLHAISNADGPVVRQLGDSLHEVLQAELRDRQPQLTAKIHRALDKHSDKLRLSVHDITVGSWSRVFAERSTTTSTR